LQVYMAVGGFYSARARYRKDDKSGYKLHDVNLNFEQSMKDAIAAVLMAQIGK